MNGTPWKDLEDFLTKDGLSGLRKIIILWTAGMVHTDSQLDRI